jgi:hypothetical protein
MKISTFYIETLYIQHSTPNAYKKEEKCLFWLGGQ